MSPISISFSSPSVPKFAWFESHERLTIPELNELIIQCRGATAAFSTELNDRYGTSSKDDELQIHYQRLEQTAKQINHDGTFKPYEISIHNLCDVLDDPSGAHAERTPSKLARHFLWLVSRVLGWAHALLIFYALGRETIRKLNEAQRAKIIVYVVKHEDLLFCQPLDNQASACNLAQIRINANPRNQKRKRLNMDDGASGETPDAGDEESTTPPHDPREDQGELPFDGRGRNAIPVSSILNPEASTGAWR